MGNDVNHCIFTGRAGSDAEVRYLPNGTAVANVSLAVGRSWKKDDEWQEETEWIRCVGFGKLGERMGEKISKGSHVMIIGRLKMESWEDKNTGEKRYATKIIANQMQMLGGGSGNGGSGSSPQPQEESASNAEFSESDIPF